MDQQCSCEKCELKQLFFENVTENEMISLCRSRIEQNYAKGEKIITEGTKITQFIYLKSGLVKLYRHTDDGKEQIMTIAKPFDFVSILSVFSDHKYNYSIKTLEESVTCNIPIAEIKSLIRENGRFATSIIEKMSAVSDKVIIEILEIRRRNLRGRLALILLYFSNVIFKSHYFDLPISRKEIAEYIGMTTENVIRTLTEFRKDGILKIYGKTIEITDKKRLKLISRLG
jgi:CRP/FNR family transcriptional regulator